MALRLAATMILGVMGAIGAGAVVVPGPPDPSPPAGQAAGTAVAQPRPAPAPPPPRDLGPAAPTITGDGVIRGRVIDQDGAPIANARVRLMVPGPGPDPGPETATDAMGRFELRGLSRNGVSFTITKSGYTGRGGREVFRNVLLADRALDDSVEVTLHRTGVIVGRVFGADGEPAVGARVQPLSLRRSSVRGQFASAGSGDTTDDLGAFRLHGLAPGDYLVSAQLPAYLSRVEGGVWRDASGGLQGYAATFHPGTTDRSAARAVTVTSGAEVTADITLSPAALFAVAGTMLDPAGKPVERGSVILFPRGPLELSRGMVGSAAARAGGAFRLERVPAGAYTLVAEVQAPLADLPRQGRPAPMPALHQDIDVTGDVDGVVLRLTNGATVRGRLVFATPAEDPSSFTVAARGTGRHATWAPSGNVTSGPDGSFEIAGVRGPVAFHVNGPPPPGLRMSTTLRMTVDDGGRAVTAVTRPAPGPTTAAPAGGNPVPGGIVGGGPVGAMPQGRSWPPLGPDGFPPGIFGVWRVRAVRHDGRDVTEDGVAAGQDGVVTGVEIEVAQDYAHVAGTVRDGRGEPVGGAQIVALAAGGQRVWPAGLEILRSGGRSAPDGRYFVVNLAPGPWDLVALPASEDINALNEDVAELEALRPRATRVTLTEHERRRLDLVLAGR